ncbi:glycoside hydrolase family 43 protein [Pelagicoccus enzymogenes]|uniref:glycoside hydrolase family 43 protein n=1 Tax=Pelagicoccus enzymogenes TaxID=2773457 RepID=UPI00280DBAF4|nr:glycoside hydrolase family 43 protein [Pelagicoccus enzymogenes]MDQ8201074.1 glycoside hydrolase family 43 protein [Pelagicoccus enzymogenes]
MTDSVFLFAYFTGNGEKGMRLASSEDGLAWTDLADRFFIAPDRGLMRDPFLLRGPDETFHLIWTTDWESQDIGYACSKNLIDWREQRRLPVMSQIEGTRNCWAPEMTYDPKQQQFLIYWASTVKGRFEENGGSSESDYNHRMWSATTRDFESFSAPAVYFDPGFNVIDVTLIHKPSGQTRLIAKDERLHPEKKNLFTCQADTPYGSFSAPSAPFTKSWVEGPAALETGDWTYVFYDVYRDKRYEGKRTKDFIKWEDVSDQLSFPQGARHGSIVTLTRAEYEKLKSQL